MRTSKTNCISAAQFGSSRSSVYLETRRFFDDGGATDAVKGEGIPLGIAEAGADVLPEL